MMRSHSSHSFCPNGTLLKFVLIYVSHGISALMKSFSQLVRPLIEPTQNVRVTKGGVFSDDTHICFNSLSARMLQGAVRALVRNESGA